MTDLLLIALGLTAVALAGHGIRWRDRLAPRQRSPSPARAATSGLAA
jgi:hypothetical protein